MPQMAATAAQGMANTMLAQAAQPSCNVTAVVFMIILMAGFVGGMLVMLTLGIQYSSEKTDPEKTKRGNLFFIIAMVMLVVLFAVVAYQSGK